MTTRPPSPPGTYYIPGLMMNVSDGASRAQFEDPNNGAKAVVAEDGFFNQPESRGKAILLFNLTPYPLIAAMAVAGSTAAHLSDSIENEIVRDELCIGAGRATHYTVSPYCYIINVAKICNTLNGTREYLTAEGLKLSTLVNKVISFSVGKTTHSTDEYYNTTDNNNYTVVNNNTPDYIEAAISRCPFAYSVSQNQLTQEKRSRLPDQGADVIARILIPPNSAWHYLHEPVEMQVHLLQAPNALGGRPAMGFYGYPSTTNYVQSAVTTARAGQVVVFTKNNDMNGGVEATTYDGSEIKLVRDNIVINVRRAQL